MDLSYGFVFMVVGTFAAYVGNAFVSSLVHRLQRPSLIIFLIAGITALAAIFACYVEVHKMIHLIQSQHHSDQHGTFKKPFCS